MSKSQEFRDFVYLNINGKVLCLRGAQAFSPLSDILRYDQGLTGTKVVCAEGDCGACTIMYQRVYEDRPYFQSVNSCICTATLMDGCHIVTVEGLGQPNNLCEIQESMVRNFGSQCGFCTPGFVMSMANMFEQKRNITKKNVKNFLTGNLCRCTGYKPIIDAALDVDINKLKPLNEAFDFAVATEKMASEIKKPILISWQNKEFFAPTSMADAVEFKARHQDVKIFSGATDLGVQANKGKDHGLRWMSLHLIPELYELKSEEQWISVGAKVSLFDLEKHCELSAPSFAKFLHIFASPQIKNTATLVGNVANGSPIADTTPYLLMTDAEVELAGEAGQRILPLNDFILEYKKFDLKPSEIIKSIRFKKIPEDKYKIGTYKVSQRRDLDISCVNASFALKCEDGKIVDLRIALGGVGPKTLRLSSLETEFHGKEFNRKILVQLANALSENINPISDVRGTKEFRSMMVKDLFRKYCYEHWQQILEAM